MKPHVIACLLALILSGCGGGSPPGTLTTAEFAEAFASRIHEVDAGVEVKRVGELELRVSGGRTGEKNVFLDNAYREYSLVPDELDAVLDRYVNAALEMALDSVTRIDLRRIVPVIKDAAYPAEVRKSLIKAGHSAEDIGFHYEPLNPDLVIFYALDSDRNIRYLSHEDLKSLDFAPGELRQQALKNLNGLLPQIEKHGAGGTFVVTAGGTYEASLLLVDSLWSAENFQVDGEIVVAVPSRDLLLVTGSQNTEGLSHLRKLAKETVENGAYHLTSQLFVRREGKWAAFEE